MASDQWDCPTCDSSFDSENGMKVHHSMAHGESIAGVEVECAYCGETTRVNRRRAESYDKAFCDSECMGKWQTEYRVGEDNPQYDRVDVECSTCGETFATHPYRVEAQERHFCDHGCYAEALKGEERPEYENSETVECGWCGELFKKQVSKVKKTDLHFCDFDCYRGWHSENMVGENSPRWNGGLFDYGPGWTQQKRETVRERDGRKCADCGMSEREHIEERGQKLHVHHITPARDIDDPEERNAVENLIALCGTCHLGKWEKIPGLRPDTESTAN